MADHFAAIHTGNTVLLFGPQALSFGLESFFEIRSTLLESDDNRWILDTLATFPQWLKTIASECPRFHDGHGFYLLNDLNAWLETGNVSQDAFPLPNILLTPLVVIKQLTQYSNHLRLAYPDSSGKTDVYGHFKSDRETLGFCTGFLSALAVSSSADREQFQQYGAVALRLGMLIGMVVDAQDISAESLSLATVWNSFETGEEMARVLKSFPEAYTSVHYDESRATITTSVKTASAMQKRLRTAGVIVTEVGLRGRFHWEGYRDDIESLTGFCDSHSEFQFPDASRLAIPTRSNAGGDFITKGPLHHEALRSILVEPPQWYQTFAAVRGSSLLAKAARVISFGPERCVPPSMIRELGPQIIHIPDLDNLTIPGEDCQRQSDDDIAVVGMACKVAGADDLEEYWRLLSDGKSQHKEVPEERFDFNTVWRDADPKRKWYGNFINDYDKFDHKFFGKSPRETASMDPQQRQLLQIAYQAVEQSGYFHSPKLEKSVGCYVGVCACDYENNIACYAPNAFSATGNLKGFIAGKVSHYFGWTGPGLTIDTACSSSAVAVHQACRSILSGECNAALAGGTHVMTNPLWFQNLAGASFLSPTGQCKPFDAKADGYCRGEGIAAVFLKRMSTAIADGDQILGVIASTAVQQNQNCTPIFVPNSQSLSDLFRVITEKAKITPQQISVVEAHGTGTPVGDPAEYESIRQIFGGLARHKPLCLSSVKGLVGHIECTSGMASLIKVLLMIRKGTIPPQASFDMMNPVIKSSPADRMSIPTSLQPWNTKFRAALINNYGASGSNASMVVIQAPSQSRESRSFKITRHAFWFSAFDDRSLRTYAAAFRKFLKSATDPKECLSAPNLAFNLSRQSNRSLDRGLIFSCCSVDDLERKLTAYEKGESSVQSTKSATPRPVILCFGGQVSTFIGLDKQIYDNFKIFRHHLDQCNSICASLGLDSIFPEIFQRTPIGDIVKLQVMLFAVQYSCAKTWMDCGVKPVAVVGHSFGELGGMAISGILSLEETLQMIVGRATVIKHFWGAEKGAMMAVEADLDEVQRLVAESNKDCKEEEPVVIACFNGPRSFTLAGSTRGIDIVAETFLKQFSSSSMRTKRLNVTNAFHSTLVEGLQTHLERGAENISFGTPSIPIERATEFATQARLTPRFVADHMRNPVYFSHAVQRLVRQYPSSIWLEAGSNSTITSMASRALAAPLTCHFQSVNITSDNSLDQLTETTVNLWKAGLGVTYWGHHSSHTQEYAPILLPPYQFEKARHWLEPKQGYKTVPESVTQKPAPEELPEHLLTFIGYQDDQNRVARFRINTMIPKYQRLIEGHIIAHTAPICPATVQIGLAIEAIQGLRSDLAATGFEPQIQGVENQSPICIDPARSVWLETEFLESFLWSFKIFSNVQLKDPVTTLHTTGRMNFCCVADLQFQLEFARYERLVGYQRCLDVLKSSSADDIVQGRNIYKTFEEIVDYGKDYRGLQKLVGQGNESAGHVVKAYNPETWLDAYLSDCFCQVGGIWVNCMTNRSSTDMYIANGIERWIRSPKLRQKDSRPNAWDVFAYHHVQSEKAYLTDVFVFSADTGALMEVILGISYVRISKASMSILLSRLTVDTTNAAASPSKLVSVAMPKIENLVAQSSEPSSLKQATERRKERSQLPQQNVTIQVKQILAELSGLEAEEIKDDSELANIGIDSLMGMELARELEGTFQCTLPEDQLAEVTDLPGLMRCIRSVLGPTDHSKAEFEDNSDEDGQTSDGQSVSTPSSSGTTVTSVAGESIALAKGDYSMNKADTSIPTVVDAPLVNGSLELPSSIVLEAFGETKLLTDQFIADHRCADYADRVIPRQTELCIALTIEAFEQLGCPIVTAAPSQELAIVPHLPEHRSLVDYLYLMLDKESQIVKVNGSLITRTAVPVPVKSSSELLQDVLEDFPVHATANKLTYYAGTHLAMVLSGKSDGLKLIFGSDKGRELVSGLYGDWPLNKLFYKMMEDFLTRLVGKLPMHTGPLKILEMGAGTGGTTKWLVPLLASLKVPVEFTFTDLAPSFVAAARKKFKPYPFMKFRTHDIEKVPAEDLLHTQHIVIASNAVHATHSLTKSTANIRKALRPDGLLMMLEMTGTLYWVDIIFGLFEGWWLFEDGRTHAVTNEVRWESDLLSAGFGHVDWTDGARKENEVERVLIALASGLRYDRLPLPSKSQAGPSTDLAARQAVVEDYVRKNTEGFTIASGPALPAPTDYCILVTGATGSLGSHLVAQLVRLPDVKMVICLNRRSKQEPLLRQQQALSAKGISITPQELAKLRVFESNTAKSNLGLVVEDYESLLSTTTHIVHNAWLMSAKLPLKGFETQFQIMRNMLNLARDISCRRPFGSRVTFQFISSIATVGRYPLWTKSIHVPEERMTIDSVLPNGYGDAKYVCELMLDVTLHQHPGRFRTMAVRIGQIAGSKTSGYWNPMEHLSFLWKSSQTLKAIPNFAGLLSWTPVDDVAATLQELLIMDNATYPIYHIDNPVRQPWCEMIPVLADALDIPRADAIPFEDWVQRVRDFPGLVQEDNPAAKLIDFLDDNFERMSCGGLLLQTIHSREHSKHLASMGPVSDDVARKFVQSWKNMRFLT